MTQPAYVQVRPGTTPPITIICRQCRTETPAGRWQDALNDARAHNRDQHGHDA